MYYTGGIRCEKSTALMKQMGLKKSIIRKGGILRYLEIDKTESLWEGECFVFDNRVSVDHDLNADIMFAMLVKCRYRKKICSLNIISAVSAAHIATTRQATNKNSVLHKDVYRLNWRTPRRAPSGSTENHKTITEARLYLA